MFHRSVGPLGLSLRPNLATARASEGQSPACFPCFWRFSLFNLFDCFPSCLASPLGPKWHPKPTVCPPMAASPPQNTNKRYKDDTKKDVWTPSKYFSCFSRLISSHPPKQTNPQTHKPTDTKTWPVGMRARALNPHVALCQRACLHTSWVPCLHLPFCMCLLHSTFCTPPCSLTSVGFLLCFLPKESFEMIAFGDFAYSAGPGFFRDRPFFFVPFSASIFGMIFDGFWFHFWITCLMSFHILALFFRACFLYRFVIEFRMEFGLIFDVFLIPLPFAHATF